MTSEEMIEAATPVVQRVVRKRFFGASLSPSDDRYENDRARDCVQQALLELWEKFGRVAAQTDPPIQSLPNYAARVAHNAVNEVVRPPNWTRLKNRLLRVISRNTRFAIWDHPEWTRVAGYAGWRIQGQVKTHASLTELRQVAGELRADAILATYWENMGAAHWQALLERVFNLADGPVVVTTLINFLAELLDIRSEIPLGDPDPDHDRA